MRTFSPKAGDIQRQWHVIDASDVILGRLASQVAILLRGKHKPIFAPHMDTGDFVVVVNADKVALSGSKLQDKRAYRHSGYPGGIHSVTYSELLAKHPERAVGPGRRVLHRPMVAPPAVHAERTLDEVHLGRTTVGGAGLRVRPYITCQIYTLGVMLMR